MALFDGVKAPRGSHSKAEMERDENYRARRATAMAQWRRLGDRDRRAPGAVWPMWRDIEWNHYDAQPTEPRYNLED